MEEAMDKGSDMASVSDFDPLAGSIPATKVELTVSCRHLLDKDTFSKSDPMCVLYTQGIETKQWRELTKRPRTLWIRDLASGLGFCSRARESQEQHPELPGPTRCHSASVTGVVFSARCSQEQIQEPCEPHGAAPGKPLEFQREIGDPMNGCKELNQVRLRSECRACSTPSY